LLRVEPELFRAVEPDLLRAVEPALLRVDELFRAVEPDLLRADVPDFLRADVLREELLRAEVFRAEPELFRDVELLDPPFDELRDLLEERRALLERRDDERPLRRSAAGTSSRATAFASCGICFSRNLAIRSSSRRMPRASLAVSLSPTLSANASIPV
jgi:hypothetical protein